MTARVSLVCNSAVKLSFSNRTLTKNMMSCQKGIKASKAIERHDQDNAIKNVSIFFVTAA